MFMKAMPVCPGVHVTNSVPYSTEEALKKCAHTTSFITCLHWHSTIIMLQTGTRHGLMFLKI